MKSSYRGLWDYHLGTVNYIVISNVWFSEATFWFSWISKENNVLKNWKKISQKWSWEGNFFHFFENCGGNFVSIVLFGFDFLGVFCLLFFEAFGLVLYSWSSFRFEVWNATASQLMYQITSIGWASSGKIKMFFCQRYKISSNLFPWYGNFS